MWPFRKKSAVVSVPVNHLSFSQTDATERLGANLSLGPNDWIETVPLNAVVASPESMGLPPLGATAEQTYQVAERFSRVRESFAIRSDGVYCPICHIANTQLSLLRRPCPRCGRELLRFDWN